MSAPVCAWRALAYDPLKRAHTPPAIAKDDAWAVHDLIEERQQIVTTIRKAGFAEVYQFDFKPEGGGLLHQYIFAKGSPPSSP